MAEVFAALTTSHVPAMGAAVDLGKTRDDYWRPVFEGYEFAKRWIAQARPDVVILVYNDHATALGLDVIPTFALGCGAEFEPADEGGGGDRGADREGRSGAGGPHRAIAHPR